MTNKIFEYLTNCSRHYYNGIPLISDAVFDQLAQSIGYAEIGVKQHEHIEKHFFPMYSLQKYYEDQGKPPALSNFADCSPKLDGAAVSALFIDGRLSRVLTRGDGTEGTIVTEKFLATNLIPQTIGVSGVVQITGEIVAPKLIENARNYAAGALNLKDTEEFKTRTLAFIAYGVQPFLTENFLGDMHLLSNWGFETIKDKDLHNIFPCDGLVYRINNNAAFLEAGYTSKFPKGAYALKERGEAVETILLAVEWQVGKSGKVTPVAILEPVLVGDATVSRATLNNIEFIEALDLFIGCTVAIQRAGEVIPCVMYRVE